METLKGECCSTIGAGWGSPCEPCPATGKLTFMKKLIQNIAANVQVF